MFKTFLTVSSHFLSGVLVLLLHTWTEVQHICCFPNKICQLIILHMGAIVIEFSSHKTNNMIYQAICGKSVLRDMQCLDNNQSQKTVCPLK